MLESEAGNYDIGRMHQSRGGTFLTDHASRTMHASWKRFPAPLKVIRTGNESSVPIPEVQAFEADSLVENFGVNTHFNWHSTNYYSLRESHLIPAMVELGVRYFRDGLHGDTTVINRWKHLNRTYGMRALLIAGSGSAQSNYSQLVSLFPPHLIWGIEGRNEPGHTSNNSAASIEARDHIVAMSSLVRASPNYRNIKIVAPSYISESNVAHAGDLSAAVDYVNIHPYPGGSMPEASGPYKGLVWSGNIKPGGPFIATETGYHSDLASKGFLGAPEAAIAIYMPRLVVDMLTNATYPIHKVFIYEMLSQNATWASARERSFGLLDTTGAKRPQYYAIKALLNTVADPGPSFKPRRIPVRTSGNNANVKLRAFARRDGSFDILVWNQVSVSDPSTRMLIDVPDVMETVSFGQNFAEAKALRVNDGTDPAWQSLSIMNNQVTVPVGPGITILRVTP